MDPAILALIVLGVIVVLYVTEIIPLALTSVGGCIAMALLGIVSFNDAFSGFSNNVVLLIAGMMVVGSALFETGAAENIGVRITTAARSSEKIILFIIMLVVAALSAFLNNTATTAMFVTVVFGIVMHNKSKFNSKRMMMPLAFAANAGGMLTLVGSTPTVIVQGVLTQAGHAPVGFFEFAKIGAPVLLLVIVYMLTIGYKELDRLKVDPNKKASTWEIPNGDTPKRTEKMATALGIMLLCIILFATEVIATGLTAMLGAWLVLFTGCVRVKETFAHFDWTTVFVLAGSLGIAKGLEVSGAGQLISDNVLSIGFADSPYIIFATLLAIGMILTQFMSNTATTALLAPIALFISQGMEVSPYPLMLGLCTMTAAAFASPVATPPNTMVLVGGYRFKDFLLVGGVLNLLVFVLVVSLVPIIWPF